MSYLAIWEISTSLLLYSILISDNLQCFEAVGEVRDKSIQKTIQPWRTVEKIGHLNNKVQMYYGSGTVAHKRANDIICTQWVYRQWAAGRCHGACLESKAWYQKLIQEESCQISSQSCLKSQSLRLFREMLSCSCPPSSKYDIISEIWLSMSAYFLEEQSC